MNVILSLSSRMCSSCVCLYYKKNQRGRWYPLELREDVMVPNWWTHVYMNWTDSWYTYMKRKQCYEFAVQSHWKIASRDLLSVSKWLARLLLYQVTVWIVVQVEVDYRKLVIEVQSSLPLLSHIKCFLLCIWSKHFIVNFYSSSIVIWIYS